MTRKELEEYVSELETRYSARGERIRALEARCEDAECELQKVAAELDRIYSWQRTYYDVQAENGRLARKLAAIRAAKGSTVSELAQKILDILDDNETDDLERYKAKRWKNK